MKKSNLGLIAFFISMTIFILGISLKIDAPLSEWDRVCLSAAINWSKSINIPWFFDHPPGYPIFLTLVFKIFGASVFVARLANGFCLLLAGLGVYKLTTYISHRTAGLWATIFFFTSAIVIQGSKSMDVADTSLLPLGFVLLAFSFVRSFRKSDVLQDSFLMGLIISACFWLKITSTIVFLGGVGFYILFNFRSIDKLWIKKTFFGITFGVFLFLISWRSVSLSLWGVESFLAVFKNLNLILFSGSFNFFKLAAWCNHTLQIVFWFSPFFLMLIGWEIFKVMKYPKDKKNQFFSFLGMVSFFYFIVYLVIGGTNYGFPRYHVAIFPLLVAFMGVSIHSIMNKLERKEELVFWGGVFFLTLITFFVLDDPLLFLNLKWKEAVLTRNAPEVFARAILHLFVFMLLPFVMVFFLKKSKQKIRLIFLMGAFVSIISLTMRQGLSKYSTAYQYGAQGKNELCQIILTKIKTGEMVLATPELLYDLRVKKVPAMSWRIWESSDRIYSFVKKRKPSVIIMGLTTHSFEQWQDFLAHKQLQLMLNMEYDFYSVGTYSMWFKRVAKLS